MLSRSTGVQWINALVLRRSHRLNVNCAVMYSVRLRLTVSKTAIHDTTKLIAGFSGSLDEAISAVVFVMKEVCILHSVLEQNVSLMHCVVRNVELQAWPASKRIPYWYLLDSVAQVRDTLLFTQNSQAFLSRSCACNDGTVPAYANSVVVWEWRWAVACLDHCESSATSIDICFRF